MGQHPVGEALAVTFTALLHDLIALVGCRVSVCVSAPDSHPALACAGTLSGGVDVLDADADDHECLYFPLTATADAGFMLARREFTHAAWHDGVLRITLGALVIEIEPT